MKKYFILLLLVVFPYHPAFAAKDVLGWVEYVMIEPGGLKLKAKLDTGAKTSSMRAKVLKEYKKDGHTWISYQVVNGQNESITLDSRVVRWVRIKKKDSKAGFLRRPVVRLGFCMADKFIIGEVNLSPRTGFLYPVLVGRNMLKRHILIDTHKTLTTEPTCNTKQAQ